MITVADGNSREGWALKDPCTGNICLPEICESESDAYALNRAMAMHQPLRGSWVVIPVTVTVVPRQLGKGHD